MTLPDPWDSLKLKPLSPDEWARVLELVSRPIIEPPCDPWLLEHCWPAYPPEVIELAKQLARNLDVPRHEEES